MIKVVIADNDTVFSGILKEKIEKANSKMCVTCVTNGNELVEKIQNGHADVVLTELVLPDMDGIFAIKQLQEIKSRKLWIVNIL